jgi:hypothetical protein
MFKHKFICMLILYLENWLSNSGVTKRFVQFKFETKPATFE